MTGFGTCIGLFWTLGVLLPFSLCADVYRVSQPVSADGRFDEAAWSSVKWESGFRRFRNAPCGREVKADTSFAILADAEHVYVGVKCEEPALAALKAQPVGAIWSTDAVELEFAPDGGAFDYYQFLVTLKGLTYAMFYSEGGQIRPDPFGPAWEAAVGEYDGGWTVEAKIPLAAFYMTRNSNWRGRWRINVARNRPSEGYSSWSDLEKSFLEPRNFNTVTGFPVRRAEEDVWVKSAVPAVKGKHAGRLMGTLTLVVYAAKAGDFTIQTSFTEQRSATLSAGETEVVFDAVYPGNGRLPAEIRLTRAGGQAPLVRTYPVIIDYQPIRVKLTTPEYRNNFYPGQCADIVEGLAVTAVEGPVKVSLEGPGLAPQAQTLDVSGLFRFDTKGFKDGEASLKVQAGPDVKTVKIRKLAPLPEGRRMSWISKGNLIVDGKPVFRRNLYAEYYMGGEVFKRKYDADDLHQTRDIRSIGTFEPQSLIKGIEQQEATRDVKPCAEIFAEMDKVIARGAESGQGVYYYISDEPECREVSPVYLKYMYDYLREKDPYHVVLCASRAGERYLDCADWFETHPYINPHHDAEGRRVYGRPFSELGNFVDAFKPGIHPDKCIGGMPTCFAYSGGEYPTFREYVTHCWCFLVRGVKTFWPYAYHDLGDTPILYEGVRYTHESVAALADLFLNAPRTTLLRTPAAECALWEQDGAQLFALVNFTGERQRVEVEGLRGTFREFRGRRTFADGGRATMVFELDPIEAIVASTKPFDTGLKTYAEVAAAVAASEAERRNRDNQLLGRHYDVAVTTSVPRDGVRKMFDGTRDVIAWYDVWGTNKYYEVAFPKFVPRFRSLVVYGVNIAGMQVKIRKNGDWTPLVPAKTETLAYGLKFTYAETHTTVKMRLEFPLNKVELYEIELPRVPGAAARTSRPAPASAAAAERVFWTKTVPAGCTTNVWWYVPRDAEQEYLVFDFQKPRIVEEGKYINWGIYLNKTGGHLAGNVTRPQPGLYTLRLPDPRQVRTDVLIIRNYNLALDIGTIACVKAPANYAEFLDYGDAYKIKVVLDVPCEDLSCSFTADRGTGPFDYAVNGTSTVQLKPLDATRRVWGTEIVLREGADPVGKEKPLRPGLRVTVLGGALDRPIYTYAVGAD